MENMMTTGISIISFSKVLARIASNSILDLSRSMRLKGRNSHSRLKTRDLKREILVLVWKHETERTKFSLLSRKLNSASRWALS